MIKNVLKKIVVFCLYTFFKAFRVRKNIALFSDFYGKRFTNDVEETLKYLLRKNFSKVKFVIVYNDLILNELPQNVRVVRRFSVSHIYYAAIAGVRVNSCHESTVLKKRKGVLNVQLWHGTPLKKIGLQVQGKNYRNMRKLTLADSATWDLLVAPNDYVKSLYCNAFGIEEGLVVVDQVPRDRVILNKSVFTPFIITSKSISNFAQIKKDKKLCLYAPTFRDDDKLDSKIKFSLRAYHEKYNEHFILGVRLHSNVISSLSTDDKKYLVDFSKFNDLPLLLRNTDLLITDYSSLMFDFQLLGLPIIRYAHDFRHYTDKLRELNFDYDKMPGSVAYTEKELFEQLDFIIRTPNYRNVPGNDYSAHSGEFYNRLDQLLSQHNFGV
jgi:CDP-glycerol glycerophosphotransferase